MVQLGLLANSKCQVLPWYGATLTMKVPGCLLGPSDITSCEIRKVVIQIAEPVSIIEATEILVKILKIIYARVNLKQVVNNATQLKSEE